MADAHPPAPDNEALERTEKVRLENQVLRRQLTRRFLWLAWAKAITGPAAALGLVFTMYLAWSQREEARRARDDERFERAIARIGSTQVPERLTGIAGLEQFLKSSEPERQAKSLQYLVNGVVIEPDATARSAILDIFSGLIQTPTA
jgi:hypothetical protein